MKKYFIPLFIITLFTCSVANAQVRMRVGGYSLRQRHGGRYEFKARDNRPKFEPTVNLSFGYGFPNQDKDQLVIFNNYYKGDPSQTGPITGALDYQFSRSTSVGVMVTHGTVSAPYYNNNSYTPAFTGSLENWAIMFNLVNYMPTYSGKVSPYLRTAIGINTWKEDYKDASTGAKLNLRGQPQDLAYQVGLGAKFNLSKNAGIFIEGGYGKYILHGGLAFKF